MPIVRSHEESVAARLWLAFIVVFAMVVVLVPHGARADGPPGESPTSVIVREAPEPETAPSASLRAWAGPSANRST